MGLCRVNMATSKKCSTLFIVILLLVVQPGAGETVKLHFRVFKSVLLYFTGWLITMNI